jgi:hypothetical protein
MNGSVPVSAPSVEKASADDRNVYGLSSDAEIMTFVSKGVMGVARGVKIEAVPVKLAYNYAFTTVANTVYNTVLPLAPSITSEWSSFAGIFSEVKVDKVDFYFWSTPVAAASPGLPLAVLAYDPMTVTPLASLASGCEYAQHHLFQPSGQLGINTIGAVALADPKRRRFHIDVPRGTAISSGSASTMGNQWSSTADSADAYGFIKPYVEAGGAGTQLAISGILYFHCQFRSRA